MDSPNFDQTLLQPHKKSKEDLEYVIGSDAKTVKMNESLFESIKSPNRFSKHNKSEKFGNEISLNERKHSKQKSMQKNSKSKSKLDDSMRGRSKERTHNKISKRYKEKFNKSLLSKSQDRRNPSMKPRKSLKHGVNYSKNKSMMRSVSKDQNRSRLGEISSKAFVIQI